MSDSGLVYTPSQVCERLGVQAAMLRRYSNAYEKVVGRKLARSGASNARLYTKDDLEMLEKARELVRNDSRLSVEKAFSNLVSDSPVITPIMTGTTPSTELLEQLLNEVKQLRSDLSEYRKENRELNTKLLALEVSKEQRPWWRFWS